MTRAEPTLPPRWLDIYERRNRCKGVYALAPLERLMRHHRLPVDSQRDNLARDCRRAVTELCRRVERLVHYRRRFDEFADKTVKFGAIAHMAALSEKIHRHALRVEAALLDAYDAHGFALSEAAGAPRAVGERNRETFAAAWDCLKNERMRATYYVHMAHSRIEVPLGAGGEAWIDRARARIVRKMDCPSMVLEEFA